ncbi:ABC transporter permease [Planomonospora venezuelensis]|uniref:ABC-2 type transport system permease protein n=1 Tax=Planomonospora venezuelensis TaxID=1999 RepID=A0A841D9U7_PLAVE|nr:ABC transporter permease [Planomonospora venezuelensis]MBB5964166.1 ABC-2 type transport system permease protein [Planomonospora venezuelensis]GIN05362.1 ABC transporter [Planomonospora venezuelensis]
MSLLLTHARYQFLETVRVPIAVIGNGFFPAASMLFFVVPFAGDHPVGATMATASMMIFAVMSSGLFTHGLGVAEDRAQPWDPYTRTLPAGPWPRLGGRILNAVAMTLIGVVPVLLVSALLTEATVTPVRLLLGLGALLVASVPFQLLGLFIGYALPSKAAIAVVQLTLFPMAVGGGLLTNPVDAPAFIDAVAPFLPSRGAVELVWAAIGHGTPGTLPLVMFGVWTAAAGALAAWAYRRDEGNRFR